MMQMLASEYTQGVLPEGPARGIIDRRTAMDAVMRLFAVIDQPLQEGLISEAHGLHGMSMLMVVREYVASLPDPPGEEQLLRSDLEQLKQGIAEGLDATDLGR